MLNFDPALIAPFFDVKFGFVNLTSPQTGIIARANPNRVALVVGNQNTTHYIISANSIPSSANGILIPAGQNVTLDFATYGGCVGMQWTAFPLGAGGNLVATEIIYRPTR